MIFPKISDERLAAQRKAEEIRSLIKRSDKAAKFIAAGCDHTVGLKADGTAVAAAGGIDFGGCCYYVKDRKNTGLPKAD